MGGIFMLLPYNGSLNYKITSLVTILHRKVGIKIFLSYYNTIRTPIVAHIPLVKMKMP